MKKEKVSVALVVIGLIIAAVGHVFGWGFNNGVMWVSLLAVGALLIIIGFLLEYRRTHPFGFFR